MGITKAGYKVVNSVHDEIKVQLPNNQERNFHAARIQHIMQSAFKLTGVDLVSYWDLRTSFSKEDIVKS